MSGIIRIGGIRAESLADRHGTPLLVIDLDFVRARIEELRAACDPLGIAISYAGKALLTVEFARFVESFGIGLDVCSMGELATAERAGFPRERITFHGAGKTEDELRAVADGRAGRIIVDGIDELRELSRLTQAPIDVVLRLNTGVEAHAHEFLRTAGDRTKFGIDRESEDEALSLLRANEALRLTGLHGHIGSQIDLAEPFVPKRDAPHGSGRPLHEIRFFDRHAGRRRRFRNRCQRRAGASPGFHYKRARYGGAAVRGRARNRRTQARDRAWTRNHSRSGTTLYRVMTVKRHPGRTFVIVDGGMADNPRPALYGAHHDVVADGVEGALETMTVCGRSCENDELVDMPLPVGIARGSLLAMATTGAYTYSMASNYNRFTRPAVVAVENGVERLLARRETLDDLISLDLAER